MAFGSTFGRVISPTFAPKSLAGVGGGPWWLAGEIDPGDCIGAYQAKGAADYAGSKVNLNNPGTRNLTETTAPDWDIAKGWTVVKGAKLSMGDWIFDTSHDYSWICKLTFASGDGGYPINTPYNYAITVQVRPYSFQTIYRDTQKSYAVSGVTSGVFAVTRYGVYKDGVAVSSYSASQINSTRSVSIEWNASSGAQMDIAAWALYQIDIASYSLALAAAMSKL